MRDKTGHEIDLIIDKAGKLLPVEIKSGKTIHGEFFKNMEYYCKLSSTKKSLLLYAGDQSQRRSNGTYIKPWKELLPVPV